MQIILDISEEDYLSIKDGHIPFKVLDVIRNATTLPKGHGRLGDLDMLEKEVVNGIKAGLYEKGYEEYGHINDVDDCMECIKCADTIIEADKLLNNELENPFNDIRFGG